MAASHVPKFGNWDGENVPYTACFENARKSKSGAGAGGGKIMNPNDPEENPDAFSFMSGGDSAAVTGTMANNNSYHRNIKKNMSSESESISDNKSSFSHSSNVNHQFKRSEVRRKKNESSNSFIPTSTPRNGRNPSDDLSYRSSASVPKFGAWDEMDPKSGEGFTVIFNKVKQEKQIAASKVPNNVQSQPKYYSNYNDKPSKSKRFCCLC